MQDPDYFPLDSFFPGNFALLFWGTDPNSQRYAGAGALGTNTITRVDIDCSADLAHGGNGWGLDGCPADVNDNGQAASNPIKGTFSATIDQHTGRGDFVNLQFPSDPNGYCIRTQQQTACSYAYYIINHNEMILIAADPITKPAYLTLWSASRQLSTAGGWTLSALQGTSVMELNAVDPNGGTPLADVTAGLFVSDGAGNATFNFDENKGGTPNLQQSSAGTYALDSTGQKTGRMTFSGFSQFGTTQPVIYMISSDNAVLVGTDPNVTSGVIEPQSGSPFSDGSVINLYAGGSSWPVLSAVTNSVTALFADGTGNISATQNTSGPNGNGGPTNLTLTYDVDATGRAVVQQGGNPFGVLYVVSPSKAILLPLDSTPTLNVFASGPSK